MNPLQRFVAYLRASKVELEKVAWPTRNDLIRYTSLIIGVSLVAAIFFATLDTLLHGAITAIISHRVLPAQTTQSPIEATTEPIIETEPITPATSSTDNVITGAPTTPVTPSQP